jgi:hypothetical protein
MMFKPSCTTILLLLLVLVGCNKTNDRVEILARVGTSVLTKDAMLNRYPEYREAEVENQAMQWIKAELLYLAGVSSSFNKDRTIVSRVDDYRKKLIGQTYLDMALRSRVSVSTEEVKAFYLAQKETFRRKRGEALIHGFSVDSKKDANKIRVILEKDLGNKSRNELFEKHDVGAVSVKEGELLPAINKSVFGGSKTNYIGPIKAGSKFVVVEVIKRFPKGTYRSLDYVYDNIYLVIQKRKAVIQSASIIDSLRQEYLFELNVGGV